jgi:hypothetical protein
MLSCFLAGARLADGSKHKPISGLKYTPLTGANGSRARRVQRAHRYGTPVSGSVLTLEARTRVGIRQVVPIRRAEDIPPSHFHLTV